METHIEGEAVFDKTPEVACYAYMYQDALCTSSEYAKK